MADIGVTQIHHSSVIVTDPDRARDFYTRVLGMEEVPYPSTFSIAVIWFKLAGQQIHLMIKDQPDTISPRHVALQVADAVAARAALRQQGVEIKESVCIPGSDRFFIRDPDGNCIELIEWKIPWGDGPM